MIVPFKYYLHDEYSRDEFREVVLEDQLNLEGDLDDLMEKIGRPFYEVTLDCTLDTRTGEVTVEKVKL